MRRFDCIIIGSGQGGTPLALAFAQGGRKTALVEKSHVGGTCVNEGCTPTKTMVASARLAWLARRGAEYGVRTGEVGVDLTRVRQRKRDLVESFRSGSQARLQRQEGLALIPGSARFRSSRVVEVERPGARVEELEAETIVIDTGTRPSIPVLQGIEQAAFLDSTSVMELDRLPEHLLIIGGGYIGLEFGQMFRRFGARVSILQRGAQLLSREDPDIAAGVESDARGFIRVDDRLQTTADGIYAIGDVKGGPAFTHISYDDFRILKTNLLDGGKATTRNRLVPYTVYIDPQLGRVGLSEKQAAGLGIRYRLASMPMLQIAMMAGLPYRALRDGVFAHPTLAESLNNVFASLA